MAHQINPTYCEKNTKNHQISLRHTSCIQNLNRISRNEGSTIAPFGTEVAVNLDLVELAEAKKAKRSRNRTMDAFFAVRYKKKAKVLLCEYKLKLKTPTNLKKGEIDEKIRYSISLVGQLPPINPLIFIFKKKDVNQGYNVLRRFYPRRKDIEAHHLESLKKKYF